MPVESLLEEVNRLFAVVQKTVYFNIILPLSVTMYMRMLERQLKQMEIDIIEFDLFGDMPELDAFNPNVALKKLRHEFEKLSPSEKESVSAEMEAGRPLKKNVNGFRLQLKEFLEQFGHLSDNGNNFTSRPWRENLPFVIKMVREFEDVTRKKEARICYEDLNLRGFRKLIVKLFYRRTRQFTLFREQVSKNYFYGYGLFRSYFLRIANWLVDQNWLNTQKDIFYLHWDEIKTAIAEKSGNHLMTMVDQRKAEMEEYKDIILPDVIYGEEPPPLFSEDFDRMHGTPTSQGYYSGPAKVVFGRNDFDKVEHGDIIVIPYSDIGWTPLFSRAGAVIAESGGILSHSSIIAREYQIPAVVSVSNCMRLKDNQLISVNGFTGEIVLLQEEKV
jgi:phosphohistidine swiveling domain-containing protein